MSIRILFILLAFIFINASVEEKSSNVYLIGDSTMANKKSKVFPETGWGQVLELFFNDKVKVYNHAVNGRSTKSFIDEGRWQTVLDSLQKGDYVFIQFGHNDQKEYDPKRYADPFGTYTENLTKFISDCQQKEAIPILLTSIVRRNFDENGNLIDTHKDYPVAMRQLAKKVNVPLIDLEKLTKKLVQSMGSEKSKEIYLWTQPDDRFPEGKKDDTHLNVMGAKKVASMVSKELAKLSLSISDNVVDQRPVVGLDNWYNREYHKKTGLPFHYLWNDINNSGFSQLGDLFKKESAILTTIEEEPTIANLGYLDVYIIVDPDTPKETENPNYITEVAIDNIENWVKEGGTLLLMANDGPNCEFVHFNELANIFGFEFVPITLNPVLNKDWEMGAESNLPRHLLFKDVEKIYMKEVAPIKISKSAHAVLLDAKDIFIAETEYGEGKVLAIGDPWLYNEYIDHDRLPESFQNKKAAANLVEYLIGK